MEECTSLEKKVDDGEIERKRTENEGGNRKGE